MGNRDINEILKELQKEQQNDQGSQNKEIKKENWDYVEPGKRSYQPTKYELDDDNPPEDDD
jgi:hypothetical protein